jgi:Bardet-Biedl syndrome 2 protein
LLASQERMSENPYMVLVFTLHLEQSVKIGCVALGIFDGFHPCLALATTSGKVVIHNPHEKSIDGIAVAVQILNIDKPVTSLVAGRFSSTSSHDVLVCFDVLFECLMFTSLQIPPPPLQLVGTSTNVLAYDVMANADLFHVEVPDGVLSLCMGSRSALAGGCCTVVGLDERGAEAFWAVCGGNVGALCMAEGELVAGADDCAMRFYRGEEQVAEASEADAVAHLVALGRRSRIG